MPSSPQGKAPLSRPDERTWLPPPATLNAFPGAANTAAPGRPRVSDEMMADFGPPAEVGRRQAFTGDGCSRPFLVLLLPRSEPSEHHGGGTPSRPSEDGPRWRPQGCPTVGRASPDQVSQVQFWAHKARPWLVFPGCFVHFSAAGRGKTRKRCLRQGLPTLSYDICSSFRPPEIPHPHYVKGVPCPL